MSLVKAEQGLQSEAMWELQHRPDEKIPSISHFLSSLIFYFVILRMSFYGLLPPFNNIWYINLSSLGKRHGWQRVLCSKFVYIQLFVLSKDYNKDSQISICLYLYLCLYPCIYVYIYMDIQKYMYFYIHIYSSSLKVQLEF